MPNISQKPRIGLILTEDAVSMDTPKLMGRQSAGYGFLKACLQYTPLRERITLVTPAGKPREAVQAVVKSITAKDAAPLHLPYLDLNAPAQWAALDVVHMPAPLSNLQMSQRSTWRLDHLVFTGVTHTISSAHVMQQLADYVRAPTRPSDALICTSQSVRTAVERIWRVEKAVLQRRFGKFERQPELPGLPIIPLGVHSQDFAFSLTDRLAARTTLGLSPEELVVLFVGRLSFHAKANPVSLYRAVAELAVRTGQRIRILECGWFANDATEKAFNEVALHHNVKVQRLDGRNPQALKRSLAAADVFCSLSDNIQETFGLTPIEAMAAGLPCILSDWDGYRETLQHGQHGFLIPTQMPGPSGLDRIEQRFASDQLNYDHYIGHMQSVTAVDIEQTVQALQTLATRADLRQQMGAAGREHVRQHYDWAGVVAQYDALWTEQTQRQAQHKGPRLPRIHAAQLSPGDLFRHYPTQRLVPSTPLYRAPTTGVYTGKAAASAAQAARQWDMWSFLALHWVAGPDQVAKSTLALHPEQAQSIHDWGQALQLTRPQSLRLAAWLIKTGQASTQPPVPSSALRSVHLIAGHSQHASRADIQRLLADKRCVLSLTPGTLQEQLHQIQRSGGHAVLLSPEETLHDFWLVERLQDAFAAFALVKLSPSALAIRHDLLTEVIAQSACEDMSWATHSAQVTKALQQAAQKLPLPIGDWPVALSPAAVAPKSKKRALVDAPLIAPKKLAGELVFVCATRLSTADFWTQAPLGLSLTDLQNRGVAFRLELASHNTSPLATHYNKAIALSRPDSLLVFLHDDVRLDDFEISQRLSEALAVFDVVGVAGNKGVKPGQGAWAFAEKMGTWDLPHKLLGGLNHITPKHTNGFSLYGPTRAAARLLDGVFIAARAGMLQQAHVRFAPELAFHLYDLDFCLHAHRAGLRLGVWPVAITHYSPGDYRSDAWKAAYKIYRQLHWPQANPKADKDVPNPAAPTADKSTP